jgi:hypothetical protein
MGPSSPSSQAAQRHEHHEVLVEALALVLVVAEVLVVLVVVSAPRDLEKELELVVGLVPAGQDNLHLTSMILTNQCCTDHHFLLKGSRHKNWHHPRHSSNSLLPKTLLPGLQTTRTSWC